ncbi:MAG: thioredoxin family protein [Bacteroidota bacterium]
MRIYIILYLSFSYFQISAQPIKFINSAKSWNEVLQKAKILKKPIFVDIYTTWCGPCKKMDQEVFANKDVGSFYNLNFLNVKIDAEKGWGKQFIKENQVNSYPTYIYFDEKGNTLSRSLGYMPKEIFVKQGQRAFLTFKSKTQIINQGGKLDSIYNSKNYNVDFLYKYIKFQGKIRPNRCELIEEYLAKVPKNRLVSDSVMNLIYLEAGSCLIKPESKLLNTLFHNYKNYPIKSSSFQSPYNILISKLLQVIDSASTKNSQLIAENLINKVSDSLYVNVASRNRQLNYFKALYFHRIGDKKRFIEQFNVFCEENIANVDTAVLYKNDIMDLKEFFRIEKSKGLKEEETQLKGRIYSEALQITTGFITLHRIYKSEYRDTAIETKMKIWVDKCLLLYSKNPIYVRPIYMNSLSKMK